MAGINSQVRKVLRHVAGPLFRHLLVGGAVAALLALVPPHLPQAAAREKAEVVASHVRQLEQSLAQLDWTRVRFHASQLELLEPADAERFQAMAAKADMLRNIIDKPTGLSTPGARAAAMVQVKRLERLKGGRVDPDAETVRALVLWSQGETRLDEHRAAAVAGQALWSSPQGFTLAPMARMLVKAYLRSPAPAEVHGEERFDSVEALLTAAALGGVPDPGSPLATMEEICDWMLELDTRSTDAYLAMIDAQARGEIDQRNRYAEAVVAAWEAFDERLVGAPAMGTDATVLRIFRLNDVMLTHALWFTTQPATGKWPQRLAEMGRADNLLKLAVAPARLVWARRYADLMEGPARELIELQEAQRFEALETKMLAYERHQAELAELRVAPPALRGGSERFRSRGIRRIIATQGAASEAADLGLYRSHMASNGGQVRRPVALEIGGNLQALEQDAIVALATLGATAGRRLSAAELEARRGLEHAPERLRSKVLARGPRLF